LPGESDFRMPWLTSLRSLRPGRGGAALAMLLVLAAGGCKREGVSPLGPARLDLRVAWDRRFGAAEERAGALFLTAGRFARFRLAGARAGDLDPAARLELRFLDPRDDVAWSWGLSGAETNSGPTYRRIPLWTRARRVRPQVLLLDPEGGVRATSTAGERLFVVRRPALEIGDGWHGTEVSADGRRAYRWMSGVAWLRAAPRWPLAFFELRGNWNPECQDEPPGLSVRCGGEILTAARGTEDGGISVGCWLAAGAGGDGEPDALLELTATPAFTPADCRQGADDHRELAVMVDELGLSPIAFTDGWYPPERQGTSTWRWSRPRAELTVPVFDREALLLLDLEALVGPGCPDPVSLEVLCDGRVLASGPVGRAPRVWAVQLPPAETPAERLQRIELRTSPARTPTRCLDAADQRVLGVRLNAADIEVSP
jgi:hypothetical protein